MAYFDKLKPELYLLMLLICILAGRKDAAKQRKNSKPLEGCAIFLDLVGRKNYVGFEKKLKLLGAVCSQRLPQYAVDVVMIVGRFYTIQYNMFIRRIAA